MPFWEAAAPIISAFAGGLGQGAGGGGPGYMPFSGTLTSGSKIFIQDSPGAGVNSVGGPGAGVAGSPNSIAVSEPDKILTGLIFIMLGFAAAKALGRA